MITESVKTNEKIANRQNEKIANRDEYYDPGGDKVICPLPLKLKSQKNKQNEK